MADHIHRAHHVGSLLRPAALREAWRNADPEALRAAQDSAIRDVVAMQEALGLAVVTDGEFRRLSYWNRFVEQVDGLEVGEARFSFTDESGDRLAFTAPHVTGKVARTAPISGHEVEFVRSITDRDIKITLPSPSTMQFWFGPLSGAYESSGAFFDDLAPVYREEIADLAERGANLVQLDEVALAMLCDSEAREVVAAAGEDPEQLVDDYVAAIAGALRDAPAERDDRDARLSRQLQGSLDGERRLRARRREGVRAQRRRDALPRVRLRAVGGLRAATPRSRRHDGRARVGQLEVTGARAARRPAPPHRRGVEGGARRAARRCRRSVGSRRPSEATQLTEDDEKRKLARIVEVCEEVWGSE